MKEKNGRENEDVLKRTYYGSLVLLFIVFVIFLFRTSYYPLPDLYAGETADIIEDTGSHHEAIPVPAASGSDSSVSKTVRQKNIINDLTVTEKLVNINNAPADELCTLKGIGAKTAEAIVKYREINGGFKCKEDLMKVKGIGKKKYSALADKIVL